VAVAVVRIRAAEGSGVHIGETHNYGVNNGDDVASALQRTQYSSMAAGGPR
jgi:hypothetical protein